MVLQDTMKHQVVSYTLRGTIKVYFYDTAADL